MLETAHHANSTPLMDGWQTLRPTGLASISVGYAGRQLHRQSCGRAAGIQRRWPPQRRGPAGKGIGHDL
jgi:hypothetical protein